MLPNFTPAFLLSAKDSFVRWMIKSRSISLFVLKGIQYTNTKLRNQWRIKLLSKGMGRPTYFKAKSDKVVVQVMVLSELIGVKRMLAYRELVELETRMEEAIQFLLNAVDKSEPYPTWCVLHSIRVGLYLQQCGYVEEIVLAGILHDILEDTPMTPKELQEAYGERVAGLVQANTHDTQVPRLERSRESLERCLQLGKDALLVAAADYRDNLQAYLHVGNPDLMDWLKDNLKHFLDKTQSILGESPVWHDIQKQYEQLISS